MRVGIAIAAFLPGPSSEKSKGIGTALKKVFSFSAAWRSGATTVHTTGTQHVLVGQTGHLVHDLQLQASCNASWWSRLEYLRASAVLQPSPRRNTPNQLCCFPSLCVCVLFPQIKNKLLRSSVFPPGGAALWHVTGTSPSCCRRRCWLCIQPFRSCTSTAFSIPFSLRLTGASTAKAPLGCISASVIFVSLTLARKTPSLVRSNSARVCFHFHTPAILQKFVAVSRLTRFLLRFLGMLYTLPALVQLSFGAEHRFLRASKPLPACSRPRMV